LFLDTNLLVYALDNTDQAKRKKIGGLIASAMATETLVLSPQSLNELYRVITDRLRLVPKNEARFIIGNFIPFCTAPLDSETTRLAWTVQDQTGFSWWDCVLLASAIRANCEKFLTEDLQSGRVIFGMTILNPFL
jgi:predicted nucleic acid-binding protein